VRLISQWLCRWAHSLPETQQLFKTAEVPLDKEICLILEMMNNSKTSQVSERLHQIASIRDTALQQTTPGVKALYSEVSTKLNLTH